MPRRKPDLGLFADHLETARFMWRRYRKLVEAPRMPKKLRRAFRAEFGRPPSDEDCGVERIPLRIIL